MISLISGENAFNELAKVLDKQVEVALTKVAQSIEEITTYQNRVADAQNSINRLDALIEIAEATKNTALEQSLRKEKAIQEEILAME